MPKYIIYREHNSYPGTTEQEEVGAENIYQAEKLAYQFGLEMVSTWAELVEGTEDD